MMIGERQFHTDEVSKIDIPRILSVDGTGKYASTMRKHKRKETTWDFQNRESCSYTARLDHSLSRQNMLSDFDFLFDFLM